MANRMKGESALRHDGADLTLRVTAGVLLEVEDRTGIGLLDLEGGLSRMRVVATLLASALREGCGWAGSVEDAAEMMLTNPNARRAVLEALTRAMPDADPDPAEGDAPADPLPAAGMAGAGTNS